MEQQKVLVAITSNNRPSSLVDLVVKLAEEPNVDIVIFDDKSDVFPDVINKYPFVAKVITNPEHRGKAGFWKTYNDMMAYIKDRPEYEYIIILPDDVDPCPNFIEEAINAYINCGGICISPLLTNRSLAPGISRWGRKPIERKDGYYLTHYFDC